METNRRYQVSQLDWLLDDLVLRVAHIERAVFLSQDGLALGASRGLDQADAEHLAALAAGFQSLARGAGRHFGGGEVRQTIIEMSSGFLFVTAAGHGTCLAVLTGARGRRGTGGLRDGGPRPAHRRPPAGQHAAPVRVIWQLERKAHAV